MCCFFISACVHSCDVTCTSVFVRGVVCTHVVYSSVMRCVYTNVLLYVPMWCCIHQGCCPGCCMYLPVSYVWVWCCMYQRVCTSVFVPVVVCMYPLKLYVPVWCCVYQCVCTSCCLYVPVWLQCVCTNVVLYVPVWYCMYQCFCTSYCLYVPVLYVPVVVCMYQCCMYSVNAVCTYQCVVVWPDVVLYVPVLNVPVWCLCTRCCLYVSVLYVPVVVHMYLCSTCMYPCDQNRCCMHQYCILFRID